MGSNTQPPTSLRKSSRIWPWAVPLVLVGLIAGLAWYRYEGQPEPAPTTNASVETAPDEAAPAGEELPPQTEERAAQGRDYLKEASTHVAYKRWLEEPEVFSRVIAALARVADGESPSGILAFVAPAGRFEVLERNGKTIISPASFSRYDEMAQAVASLDAENAVAAYRALKPTLSRLHREIAPPGVTLDATVRRALTRLIETPTTGDEVEVVSAKVGANYELADPKLESLSAAQKHLLRMGPKNAARVQAKARELLEAMQPLAQR